MENFSQLQAGEIALIMQEPNGRICQIAITEEQHNTLKLVMAAMSKERQFVKMPEEYDFVLKKQKHSKEVLNNILFELDTYAREFDSFEFGLPTSNEDLEKMRNIILKNLQ